MKINTLIINNQILIPMQSKVFKNFEAQWKMPEGYLRDNDNKPFDPIHNNHTYKTEIKIYKDSTYITTIEKSLYRSSLVLIEWFESESLDKTFMIVNTQHGFLSVYLAETGEHVHDSQDDDMFINEYKVFDSGEYIYTSGWFWNPLPMRCIYHIPTFLITPEYEPTMVSCDDVDSKNYTKPGIKLFGCTSCIELLENMDEIFENIARQKATDLFNKNRSKDTFLRRFLETEGLVDYDEESKSILENILSSDRKLFYIHCFGNESGVRLHYENALYSEIESKYDNFNYELFNKMFYFVDCLPIKNINLRFEIFTDLNLEKKLVIWIKHDLIPCDKLNKLHKDAIPSHLTNHNNKIDPNTMTSIRCRLQSIDRLI